MRFLMLVGVGGATGSYLRPLPPSDEARVGMKRPMPGSFPSLAGVDDEESPTSIAVEIKLPSGRTVTVKKPLVHCLISSPTVSGSLLGPDGNDVFMSCRMRAIHELEGKLGGRSVSSSPSTDIESPSSAHAMGTSALSPVPFLTGEQDPWMLAGDMLTAVKHLKDSGVGAQELILSPIDSGLIVMASDAEDRGESASVVAAQLEELHRLFSETGWDDEDLIFSLEHTANALRASRDVNWDFLIRTFMDHKLGNPFKNRVARGISACGGVSIESPASCVPSKLLIQGIPEPIGFDPRTMLVTESGFFRTYSSPEHPFTVRLPKRLHFSWARAVCRERVVLKELSNEGLAVSRPLPIAEIGRGLNHGCKELMIVQKNAPLTKGKFLSLYPPQQVATTERIVSLIDQLNKIISLGDSLDVTHFSQGGVKLIACPSCRSLEKEWRVQQLIDEDDSDEEDQEDFIHEDRRLALKMIASLWDGRENPLSGISDKNWDMGLISEMIARVKLRINSETCLLTPEQERLVAYEIEETEFSQCMHAAGIQPVAETCWKEGASPHIVLLDGRELTFSSEPLGTGASAVSYLSEDGTAVAKVLKVRPTTGQELCKEKAIMRALENTCAQDVVKALRVDWTRSGMDKACQAQILVMENGGSQSLESNNGFNQAEWDAALVKIVSILQSIHMAGYLHADMNMGNAVFRNREDVPGTLKVIDLGKSVRLYDLYGVQVSKPTHEIMKMETRLRDLYMAFFFASLKLKAERHQDLSERAKRAFALIEGMAIDSRTKDSEPKYAEIIEILSN